MATTANIGILQPSPLEITAKEVPSACGVGLPLIKRTAFPLLIFRLERVKHTRDRGSTGMRTGQRLDHLTHFCCAHPFDEHFPTRPIQLVSTTMRALKHLRLVSGARARDRQIRDRS